MAQLNYHHLYYFYVIAREGSIVSAAKMLHLTPQTVSGQLSAFEGYLGNQLFDRKGKRLVLNELGKMTYSYAEDIFSLGNELQQALNHQQAGHQIIFTVGVTDVIPKVFSFDLLKTCFAMEEPIRLICREGDLDSLLAELALSKVDLIISDRPLTPGSPIKAYSHQLGDTGLTFYSTKRNAKRLSKGFPESLDQEPFLISGDKSTQRTNLMAWFNELQINPQIVAEFDDSALMKFFGQSGYGVFCTPTIIEQHVTEQYNVAIIGRTREVGEQFYGISPERKLKHPGVKHLVDNARDMFQLG
ncbi:MAG: transcriptional activator NhaR [Ketobacteraceae bacterium]|nr:transcriptional activator NhaR [Ketobacteraceae bacterium]